MKRGKLLTGQEGFTLIEIIAVFIVLGILAAVAVPKYFSLISNAEDKAAMAVKAETQARANLYFANQLIATNGNVTAAGNANWVTNIGALPTAPEFPDWTIAADSLTADTTSDTWSKAYVIDVGTQMAADQPAMIDLTIP